MKKGALALIIILAIVVICVATVVNTHNSLVERQAVCEEQLANIDAQLQRRIDLIPNLVATVQSFTDHETEVFAAVTAAREALVSAQTPQQKAGADAALTEALGRLVAVAEAYPTLTSNTVYTGLMDELAGTENRIAVARTKYNEAVTGYNAAIRKIPASLVAKTFGFAPFALFEAVPGADSVPSVALG